MFYSLSRGSSGPQVTALQEALIAKGVMSKTASDSTNNVDGKFGAITHDAVIEFQQKNHLAADGIVGKETAAALGFALASRSVSKNTNGILSEAQLDRIAEIIDRMIPTGLLVDAIDDKAIEWVVHRLDRTLAGLLPPSWAKALKDLSEGIEKGDLSAIRARLVAALNAHINVPLISEETEGWIIGFFVDVVIEALKLGRTFDEALKRLTPRLAQS